MNRGALDSTAEKLTVVGLSGAGIGSLWTLWLDYSVLGVFILPALLVGLVLLATAVAMTRPAWWVPALGVVVVVAVMMGAIAQGLALNRLTDPETTGFFLANLLNLLAGALAVVAGIAATLHRRRTPSAADAGR